MKYSDLTEAIQNVKYAIQSIDSQKLKDAKNYLLDVLDTLEGEIK